MDKHSDREVKCARNATERTILYAYRGHLAHVTEEDSINRSYCVRIRRFNGYVSNEQDPPSISGARIADCCVPIRSLAYNATPARKRRLLQSIGLVCCKRRRCYSMLRRSRAEGLARAG